MCAHTIAHLNIINYAFALSNPSLIYAEIQARLQTTNSESCIKQQQHGIETRVNTKRNNEILRIVKGASGRDRMKNENTLDRAEINRINDEKWPIQVKMYKRRYAGNMSMY